MPVNDVNSTVTPLYPGITIARDVSFGPNPKDVVDIFTADKGGASRPVLMYIPGGAGNKIEQQDREANAFYDNIMRWATSRPGTVTSIRNDAKRAGCAAFSALTLTFKSSAGSLPVFKY